MTRGCPTDQNKYITCLISSQMSPNVALLGIVPSITIQDEINRIERQKVRFGKIATGQNIRISELVRKILTLTLYRERNLEPNNHAVARKKGKLILFKQQFFHMTPTINHNISTFSYS